MDGDAVSPSKRTGWVATSSMFFAAKYDVTLYSHVGKRALVSIDESLGNASDDELVDVDVDVFDDVIEDDDSLFDALLRLITY